MYRSTDVNKGYESALTATYDFTKSKYNFSNITYWPDQTTAYNFRAVSGVTAADNEALHTNDANNDYIDATTHVNTYTNNGGDLCIGAPYNDDGTLASASTETSGNINLLFKHLKTAVDFRVKAKDNIDLTNATLTVHNVQTTGKYLLGDLSFTPTGSLQDVTLPICSKEPSPSDAFGDVTFFMFTLPQALNTEGSKVSITITTANGSKYNLDISDLISTRPAAGGGYEDVHVNSWISGMEYGMIINLYKTGINNVTATMTDWENGGTANPNIHLLPWGKK
jgi:hypothetical protein